MCSVSQAPPVSEVAVYGTPFALCQVVCAREVNAWLVRASNWCYSRTFSNVFLFSLKDGYGIQSIKGTRQQKPSSFERKSNVRRRPSPDRKPPYADNHRCVATPSSGTDSRTFSGTIYVQYRPYRNYHPLVSSIFHYKLVNCLINLKYPPASVHCFHTKLIDV